MSAWTTGEPQKGSRTRRLATGRGRFVANLPADALTAAVVRSPVASGTLDSIAAHAAAAVPGVVAVLTADEIDAVCAGWSARHALFPEAQFPTETPLAKGRVRYVGEPVALVVAETHSAAVDGAEAVELHITALPPRLGEDGPPVHEELGHVHATLRNGALLEGDGPRLSLTLARVAPQPLETRAVMADWDGDTLTVHQSHQHPHQMQDIYARLLAIPEHKVRVVCPDVGGAFGIKQQLHPDEIAVVAAARLLGRTVRMVPDRSESLMADAQARDHRLDASALYDPAARKVTGFRLRDRCGIGAFPHYPRTSFGEAAQAGRLMGAPYAAPIDTEAVLSFQNLPHLGHYRGVGHPVACLATEALMDQAARISGEAPIAFRRRHLLSVADGPVTTPSGILVDRFRMEECLDALEARLGRPEAEPHELAGTGVACLLELYAMGPRYYGEGGIRITTAERAIVRMEPSGVVRIATGNTEQGQGADDALAQIVAARLGLAPDDVEVTSGDSAHSPYGGGAYGSRSTAHGGAAAREAADALAAKLKEAAGLLAQRTPEGLSLAGGAVMADGEALMSLADLAAACHFRPHLFPDGFDLSLAAVGQNVPQKDAEVTTAAVGASVVIDRATGVVTPRTIIAVHDGGTLVNPALAQAQLVGGVVQGLGQALMEAVRHDDEGQPLTGSFMDYAMPRAEDVPPIEVVSLAPLGPEDPPRGVGETGISAAPAALFNAVNDALAPLGAAVDRLPMTPEVVRTAIAKAGG